jgi:hypothetical protein
LITAGAEKYEYGYECGHRLYSNFAVSNRNQDRKCHKKAVNSVKTRLGLFDLSTSEERILEDADYIFESEPAVPVILGFEFADTYNIGDTFECDYLGLNIKQRW